jgi:hypothetical protein
MGGIAKKDSMTMISLLSLGTYSSKNYMGKTQPFGLKNVSYQPNKASLLSTKKVAISFVLPTVWFFQLAGCLGDWVVGC